MREDIKKRIEMIKRGKVPEGYKKTKVGIVPEEWETIELGQIGEFKNGLNYNKSIVGKTVQMLGVGNFKDQSCLKDFSSLEKIVFDIKYANEYLLKDDDLVFVRSNGSKELVGRCMLVYPQKEKIVFSGFCIRFRMVSKKTTSLYINYWVENGALKKMLEKESRGTNINNLNQEILSKFVVAIPLLMQEQDQIANVIEFYDRRLELQQFLIAEKQKQKKWLMQNLLAGKKRLKGFDDEWEKMHLGELLEECSLKNSNLKITNVKSVSNKQGFINQDEQFGKSVASQDLSNYKIVSYGDIAYNPSRINVGSIALYENDCMGVVSPMYVVMNTKKKLFNNYFMYFVEINEFKQKMKGLLSGSVRESLNFSDLCCMHIKLPSIQEQKAIAQILSQADKEIKLLKQQLEQSKLEKKAMMQLLLTGIVRVNEKGGE